MSKQHAFWDASALVPLCVDEMTSRRAQSQLRESMPVVWWGTLVEVHSALARLQREGKLRDTNSEGPVSRLKMLSHTWREITPSEALRERSIQLLDAYQLRAADSLQLAAALTWCRDRPARRRFVCADERLSKGAAHAGFDVVDLS